MSEFLQRVEGEIQSRRLLARGQKVLVAVSGGADSMVLLHVLDLLAKKNRWQISVAHFNHQLRGGASAADEKLVRRAAAKLRLKFFGGSADVKSFAAQSKISLEMAARKLRHEFLARVAREQKISTIALAHHADDQVELFFLRLLRGAGGEGLAGMKWRSPSPVDKKIPLTRPLLACTKAELLDLARVNKIAFRDDATNFSTDFLRNRIRNELLPLLRKNYQQAVDEIILRLMNIVGAEAEFVGEVAAAWCASFCSSRGDEAQIKTGNQSEPPHVGGCKFMSLPLAVQRKILQQQLGVWSDFKLVEQLRKTPDKFVDVHTNLSVARDAAGKVSLRNHLVGKFNPAELEQDLSGKIGIIDFGSGFFPWRVDFAKTIPRHPSGFTARNAKLRREVEFFDADQVGGKIILRHRRAGDRFQPIGMKSAVKLQDLFVNAKIPAARRRELVLATTSSGEIFWVEGLRIGENFKLTAATRRRLAWNWSKFAG